jgi:TolB-like protein
MKKLALLAGAVLCVALFGGCAAAPAPAKKEAAGLRKSVFSLPAEILQVQGDMITLRILKPTPPKTEERLAAALTQGVVDTSYLLEGKELLLNQTRVKVSRIIGDEAQVKSHEKAPPFKAGERVIIPLEKKVIAIKDFEVVVGTNKDAAKYIQEDMETLLVDSGQFSVVERAKLGLILEEIQLGQTGAIDPATVQEAGKLLGAEIILIGTLAATGEQWNVNLRLVNTETGLVIAAIHKMGPIHELKAESFREIKNIEGSFEGGDPVAQGWLMGDVRGLRKGKEGYQRIYIDTKEGANGTKQSLAMAFKLTPEMTPQFKNLRMLAFLRNHLWRDLAGFTGIKFFIKAKDELSVRLLIIVLGEKGEQKTWYTTINITRDWKEFRIPFKALREGQSSKKEKTTGQAMELRAVKGIYWLVNELTLPHGTEGIIWLDEVSFY